MIFFVSVKLLGSTLLGWGDHIHFLCVKFTTNLHSRANCLTNFQLTLCLQPNVYYPSPLFCLTTSTLPELLSLQFTNLHFCPDCLTTLSLALDSLSTAYCLLYLHLLLSYSIHASKQPDFFSLPSLTKPYRASSERKKNQLVPRLSGRVEFDSPNFVPTLKLYVIKTVTVLCFNTFSLKYLLTDLLPQHNVNYHTQNCSNCLLNNSRNKLILPLTSRI